MKAALFSLLAIPALAAPGRITEHGPQGPADVPNQVVIEKTGYSGNGCPQGTVSTLISDDRTVVTFGFDSFQAAIGPNVNPGNKQKNCQLHLGLRYPSGFQLSILQATYHGYVRLDDGVTANFISSYYFSQDASHTANSHTVLRGPEFAAGKTYTKADNVESSAVVWSPCGANGILNVNNRIALTANSYNGTGEISNDDATLKFTQKLRIAWKRCNQDSSDYNSGAPTTPQDPPYGGYGSGAPYAPPPPPSYSGYSSGASYAPQGPPPPPYGGYGGGYYEPGSYSTFNQGGFTGFTDSPTGFPPGVQVYGPGGYPLGSGPGGSSTVTITRPVDSDTEVQ